MLCGFLSDEVRPLSASQFFLHDLTVLQVAEPQPYYKQERPHRTLRLQPPELSLRPVTGPIHSRPVLNGLHYLYERAA